MPASRRPFLPAARLRMLLRLLAAALGLGGPASAPAATPPPGVLREIYTNLGGSALRDLTNHVAFPNAPSQEEILPDFAAPVDWGDNYGQRLRALLLPPATGNYVFWIASDDQSALFLSTDEREQNRRLIASVNTWTSSREWTKEPGQRSAAIRLEAGRRYLLEALQKEGGGGDHVAVRWQLPDGRIVEPIRGTNLVVVGLSAPVITRNPASITAVEGEIARFSVTLIRSLGAGFQWWRSDQPLPDATNATLAVGPVSFADQGARFRVAITNALGAVTSSVATLTVVRDTTPPTLVTGVNLGDPQRLTILFSEPVDPATAGDASRYTLDRAARVLTARVNADGRTVLLETTPLLADAPYRLSVEGVLDLASVPNPVSPGSATTISLAFIPLDPARLEGSPEPPGPSTRRGPILVSEIHYHPPPRADGRNREFVELHNPMPWPEDLSGWTLSGSVDALLPPGTLLPPRGYLVLAAAPADLAVTDGLTGVLPYSGSLARDRGRIRLHNRAGAVVWETRYEDAPPWPVAPDGGGHSLVLSRPSLGERDPQAWAASQLPGGSPGAAETASERPFRTVRLNEILARTDPPRRDFIELHNHGADPVALTDCSLTDDPASHRFLIPPGTVLAPRGHVVFDQDQLGFALDGAGETLWFLHVPTGRVLDVLRFDAQSRGVALGRTPDGAPAFSALAQPTPGQPNAARLARPVVLGEIHYEPAGGESAAEYLELWNHGTEPVALAGWRLRGAVSFDFPPATLLPGNTLVVARDPLRLRALHPDLPAARCLGPFSGTLANRGGTVRLTQPETEVTTAPDATRVTNTLHIPVDEAAYRPGGRWPSLAAGGGSSLERSDARLDGRLAAAWKASGERSRSDWITVERTGTADLGMGTASSLELMLLGPGECLVDDVEVFRVGEPTRLANGRFESGLAPWVPQGNQSRSTWSKDGGTQGSACLLLRATGRGDTANRIRVPLSSPIPAGSRVTLRARARWLGGSPEFLMRLHGNWLEATTNLLTTRALGSPGRPVPATPDQSPPSLDDVRHHPVLPAARQPVTVTVRVSDPDGLASLVLRYRVDPATNDTAILMESRGAGFFSATLPGQPAGTLVAFHLEATDAAPAPAVARFPSDAPEREALVRWGDPAAHASFGAYRIWATRRTVETWSRREALSNDLLDVTVVLGSDRVVYNVGARYSGSPYHTPGYNSPEGNYCDYQLTFPEDDPAFGETDINLLLPGNGCCEGTMLREPMAYALAQGLGIPFNHTRPVHVFFNGLRRAPMLMVDSQQANGDFVEQWWPDEAEQGDGDLHKIALWFEFDDLLRTFEASGAAFGNYTSGGQKKLARYRWNWPRRSAPHDPHNYTQLFDLHDALLTTATGAAYTQRLEATVDPVNWARTVAVEHLVGNTDSFAYGGGQNMFVYRPAGGRWSWLIWDIDFAFQAEPPTNTVFNFGGGDLNRFLRHPPFLRRYYQALQDAVDGPLNPAFAHPFLDTRSAAFRSAGFTPESPQPIKTYLASRRESLGRDLARWNFPFRVITPGGLTTATSPVTLQGVAPLPVESVEVEGASWPVQWTSVSNWTLRLPLAPGSHTLHLRGLDRLGLPTGGDPVTLAVTYTGPADPAFGAVFINEWMADNRTTLADPADGDFNDWLELVNTSPNPVSLAGYTLANQPLTRSDWVFPPGTRLDPGGYLLVWADGETNQATATSLHAAFRLNRDGESVSLYSPTGLLIDTIAFGPQAPDAAGGRYPDGPGPLRALLRPTPGSANVPDPDQAAPPLRAEWTPAEGTLRLSWPTFPGLPYRLESTTDLGAGPWETVASWTATGPAASVTLAPGAPSDASLRRFYRVVVP